MEYKVRPMELSDLAQVNEIEQKTFPSPWSMTYFERELKTNKAARYLVVCQEEMILGYVGLWLIVGEIHITTIAVREEYRGRGIGELLLISVIEFALEHEAQVITLEVRESNLAAQALYKKYGFVEVGRRRHYYLDTGEDALLMSLENISSTSFRNNFQRLKKAHAERHKLSFSLPSEL